MKVIETSLAPGAIGPYSQGYISGNHIFTSGQLPVNPSTGEMPADISEQTRMSCQNVKAILESAGSSMNQVVKTTCYLANIEDFAAFNEVYEEFFVSKPARSCFAVKSLPKGALCEIECIAELKSCD